MKGQRRWGYFSEIRSHYKRKEPYICLGIKYNKREKSEVIIESELRFSQLVVVVHLSAKLELNTKSSIKRYDFHIILKCKIFCRKLNGIIRFESFHIYTKAFSVKLYSYILVFICVKNNGIFKKNYIK